MLLNALASLGLLNKLGGLYAATPFGGTDPGEELPSYMGISSCITTT